MKGFPHMHRKPSFGNLYSGVLISVLILAIASCLSFTGVTASESRIASRKAGELLKSRRSPQQRPNAVTVNWTIAASMNTPREEHTATLLTNGKVLVTGGNSNQNVLKSAELYDPTANTWTNTSDLANARVQHTATLLQNGKVLVVGGLGNTGIFGSAELYDPTSNTWSNAAGLNSARTGHTATLLANGKVLVAGGQGETGFLASTELYDPIANSWSNVGSMAAQRLQASAALLANGFVLVSGGLGNVGNFLNTAERFNPASNTWSSAGAFTNPRYQHTTTLLQNGKVLIVGGYPAEADSDLYDPVANSWSALPNMNGTRSFHSATLLTNGKVLVAGGAGTGSASAELFDPATNTWGETAALNDDRYLHTATLLGNGKVLIAGGLGNAGVVATAELYDPLAGSNGGRKIAFGSARNGGNHDIFVMDLDGTNQIRLTNNPAYDDQPKWSPDGTKLVFMSNRDENFEIYSMNADGTAQTRLTNSVLSNGFPAWSPNGAKIAFVRGNLANASSFEIYVMNADGSGQTRLTNDNLIDGVPMWSPDSTRIVFMSGATGLLDSNNFEIYVMNANGSNRTRLTNNTLVDGQPSFSPDGTKILFGSGNMMGPTGIEIFVMNADGSNPVRLTNNAVTDGFPAWSPDGSKIIFSSGNVNDESVVELFTMDANGSNQTRLTNNSVLDWFADWQPGNTYNISGQVRDVNGIPIASVSVSLTGSATANTTTDANGNYSFSNLNSGANHVVTPSSSSYSFSPANLTFNNLNVSRIGNFVGTLSAVAISGKVTDANNNDLNNVSVSLIKNGTAAGTVQTNAQGNYSFGNQTPGANYVVQPLGSFTPSSRTFNNLTTNAVSDFKTLPGIPPQCNTPSFSKTDFGAGNTPFATVSGDFNGDGKVDIAASNVAAGDVSVLLGNGSGSFGAATNFLAAAGTYSLAVADFNNDGKLDLVTANNNANNISIMLGAGNGTFSAPTNFTGVSGPRSVVVRDFNGDGKLDLAVANFPGNNVSIFLGDGTGSMAAATTFAAGTSATSVTAADFNGDGKLDLATANFGSNNISILLGNGAGAFGAPTNFAAGTNPFFIRTADFNSDGNLDLAVPNVNSNNVSLFLGTGSGSFAPATNFAVGTGPTSVVIADYNGDGKSDIAATNNTVGTVSILLGTGTGTFSSAVDIAVNAGARPAVAADFNGDGKIDLAVPNQGTNDISVLLNTAASCNTLNSVSISGRVSNAANQALPEVTLTLSGPVTRVTQSDANGNYSFTNLAPGGNYSVTVQSTYFVTAPSRVDFFSIATNQTANFVAAPLVAPSPTPTPNDDFTSTVRDASKWTLGTQTLPPAAVDPLVTTTQVNGQLVITPLTQVTGLHYDGYVSANSFDLRNGSARVEVVKAATGGADTIFAIGSDSENFYRFMVHTTGTPTSLAPTAKGRDGIERPLGATVAQLVFQVAVGGLPVSFSIPYDAVQHRFMRFRHIATTNSIAFETSPDNINYTVQHSVTLQKSVSALTAELSAGTSNPTNPGPAVFDNFSLVTSTFQFSAASYLVNEADGSILVTVTRAGSLTDGASVDFATVDGTAKQKTKYTSAAGTLAFASGVASRTFRVLLTDNQLAEGDQSLSLLLSNPIGSGLSGPGRADLTISDNDTTLATTNSLDDARYFVTQHYYDFLSRVPDQSGLDFWISQITQCGTDVTCLRTQRITVSNAFFYEQEYQQTGSYVVRLYRAAYGNNQPISNTDANPQFPNENKKLVNYSAFSTDRARVRGGPSLAQTQLELANAFVLRSQFLAKYPSNLDGPAYVDALLATIANDLGVDLSSQRTALIDLFNQGGRGAVLYRLADDNTVTNPINNRALVDAEYNRAFVLTQYFGYLRRNPDIGGFVFWLGQVNSAPLRALEKQRAMVCSFITSLEYQQRFSPVATHNNTECQ
jgi:Tol biopolymer transport system component